MSPMEIVFLVGVGALAWALVMACVAIVLHLLLTVWRHRD